jgi:hypothetical protein
MDDVRRNDQALPPTSSGRESVFFIGGEYTRLAPVPFRRRCRAHCKLAPDRLTTRLPQSAWHQLLRADGHGDGVAERVGCGDRRAILTLN